MRFTFILFQLLFAANLFAQTNLLEDVNGDQQIVVEGFGDSITFGVGDGIPAGVFEEDADTSGPGYLGRISLLASIPTINRGVPGEVFTTDGIERFISEIFASNADTIFFLEGSNDAIFLTSDIEYRNTLQKLINITRLAGKQLVLLTIPTPCCYHADLAPFTNAYSIKVRELGIQNDLTIVDLEAYWENSYLNMPEGLHPNIRGYDAFAYLTLATLFGIDLNTESGAADLEAILGLEPGTVFITPLFSSGVE